MNGPIVESCKLCGCPGTREKNPTTHLYRISGCRCGEFWIDWCDYEDFLEQSNWLNEASRRELSSLLREKNIRQGGHVLLQIKVKTPPDPARRFVAQAYDELVATWPQSVSERLDRVLLNMAALSPRGGVDVPLFDATGRDLALVLPGQTKKPSTT